MKEQSIKKNFILNTAYQILTMIIPFITTPYIARVLTADGVGIYSYTNAYQMYFAMFAALGTVSYGSREIARNRNDKEIRSRLFWEIETLSVITTLICLVGWGIFILFIRDYKIYYLILSLSLLAVMFDISWFYTGIEHFKYIVFQNGLFRILGVVALFLFVKSKDDIAVYIAIMALTTVLANLSMWIYLPKFIQKTAIKLSNLRLHFKETLVYFIPTIATSVYTVLDKTLIGIITKDTFQNGYYEEATKIINMAKTVTFASLNGVLGSRISYLFAEGKTEEIKRRIQTSMDYILFMGLGICFGIIGVADRFVPLFFGQGFDEVVQLLYFFSPIVIIIGISNCLGAQYYTPAGLRKKSAVYIVIGAAVNLGLNICLIPFLRSRGAVIASVAAELLIMILYLAKSNGYVKIKQLLSVAWKKLIAALVMVVLIRVVNYFILSDLLAVILEIVVGAGVYVLLLLLFRDSFVKKCIGIFKEKMHLMRGMKND